LKAFQKVGGIGYLLGGILVLGSAILLVLSMSLLSGVPSLNQSVTTTTTTAPPSTSNGFDDLAYLLIIPLVPLTLVCVGWILAGRQAHKGLFTLTGCLGLVGFILEVVSFSYLSTLIAGATSTALSSTSTLTTSTGLGAIPPGDLASIIGFGLLSGLGDLDILIFAILMIVCFFSGAEVFRVKYFRYAGIMGLVSIVAIIVGVGISAAGIFLASGGSISTTTGTIGQSAPSSAISNIGMHVFLISVPLIAIPVALTFFFATAGFFNIADTPVATSNPAQTTTIPPVQPPSNAQGRRKNG
jgi:hypothetical protein